MELTFNWSRMDALTTRELYEIMQARAAVFVVEQNCPYQDADGADLQSWHLYVRANGELAAYARVVDPGVKYAQPSIGRVLTLQKFRALKIGRALVSEAIRFSDAAFPGQGIKIGAQAYLQRFYESLGFQAASDLYDEDGIPHLKMVRAASVPGALP
jgi:ElaA protein